MQLSGQQNVLKKEVHHMLVLWLSYTMLKAQTTPDHPVQK
jgi:hypothetical protein